MSNLTYVWFLFVWGDNSRWRILQRVTSIVLIVFSSVRVVKLIKFLISYVIFFSYIIPNLHIKFCTFKLDQRVDSLGNMPFILSTTNPSTSHTASTLNIVSYADKTKRKVTPITDFQVLSEEHGIVFNCTLDYRIKDYLVALNRIIKDPKLIISAFKVSKNRIIINLKNKKILGEFFNDNN